MFFLLKNGISGSFTVHDKNNRYDTKIPDYLSDLVRGMHPTFWVLVKIVVY
ncbi:hypothetical protein [Alysiella crassa]|uniref:hypothetical protein n=1 Tax=Alysiella crassa TaxID=153491 RepID=UPI0012EC5797|nr:hypothetical protein [Alysiella crassa]UOP05917.1 hypothetical protein LVJ80_08500 [Alysiella crassa]